MLKDTRMACLPPNNDGESVTKVNHVIVTSCRPPESVKLGFTPMSSDPQKDFIHIKQLETLVTLAVSVMLHPYNHCHRPNPVRHRVTATVEPNTCDAPTIHPSAPPLDVTPSLVCCSAPSRLWPVLLAWSPAPGQCAPARPPVQTLLPSHHERRYPGE